MTKTVFLSLLLVAIVGCGQRVASDAPAGDATLRIGYQKGSALHLLRVRGDLDRRLAREGVRIQWLTFPSAPPMLEAIGVGSLDLGSGGDAPCVFAQAAGYPIALLANMPPGEDDSRGILIPRHSSIRRLEDLRGKRVAISKGTGTHNFLLQVLDRAKIDYRQIVPVYLAPADARAAFDAGKVDAWAAWDPYLSVARQDAHARMLMHGGGIVTAGGFYFSGRELPRRYPDRIRAVLEEVDRVGAWLGKRPAEAARLLAPSMGVDSAVLETMNRNALRGDALVGYRPIDEEILAAQQTVADNFLRIGLLPRRIDVRQSLLTPAEYAAILPKRQETRR